MCVNFDVLAGFYTTQRKENKDWHPSVFCGYSPRLGLIANTPGTNPNHALPPAYASRTVLTVPAFPGPMPWFHCTELSSCATGFPHQASVPVNSHFPAPSTKAQDKPTSNNVARLEVPLLIASRPRWPRLSTRRRFKTMARPTNGWSLLRESIQGNGGACVFCFDSLGSCSTAQACMRDPITLGRECLRITPDGAPFLFTVWSTTRKLDGASLDEGETRKIGCHSRVTQGS